MRSYSPAWSKITACISLGGRSEAEHLLEKQRQIHEDLQVELASGVSGAKLCFGRKVYSVGTHEAELEWL